MKKPLRLLLVEDSDLDAAHLMLELRRGGFEPEITRVETSVDFERQVKSGEAWDVIISDYHLPRFSAPEALDIYRQSGLDVPFIVVSGAVGEDTAVEMMRGGAHDYLLKHKLTRLAAAIDKHVQQARERQKGRAAQDLFQAVLRASPMPAVVVDRATAYVVDGSDSFRKTFLDTSSGSGRGLFDLIEFSHPERVEQLLARGSGTAWYAVYYVGGVARMANLRCYSVEHEEASYAYLILEDVTEQHYLKAAFDAVPESLLIISAEQKLLYGNRAAEELFGNLYFGMDVAPMLRDATLGDLWWTAMERHEMRRVRMSDRPFEAKAVPFRFAGESQTSTILTLDDVADEEELRRQATHDPLTGVFNVRHFETVLADRLAEGGTLALLDLDHFKPINDELGHAAGDRALAMFAGIVRAAIRPDDLFARIGGDEFALFFPHTAVEGAVAVVEAIYARLAQSPLQFGAESRRLSVSTGLAVAKNDDSPDKLKRRTDEALYEAKRQGRGRWVVAES